MFLRVSAYFFREDLGNASPLSLSHFLNLLFHHVTLLLQNFLILNYTKCKYFFIDQPYPVELSVTMEIFFQVLQYGSY